MSKHRAPRRSPVPSLARLSRPSTRPSTRPGRLVGGSLLAAALATGVAVAVPSAMAATTVTPTDPVVTGQTPVVRDSSVTVRADRVGLSYTQTSANASYTVQSPLLACKGDNPAGTNNSPRTTITVTAPDGSVVLSQVSAARDAGVAGALSGFPVLATQPAPGNSNYRGDVSESGAQGMSATVDLTGRAAGVYTVTTTTQNMVRAANILGVGACRIATPNRNASGGLANTAVNGLDVSTQQFEYRPWQVQFKDVFGKGSVRANLDPREFRFAVGSASSPILSGVGGVQTFYGLPGAFALPSDPNACVADPSSCLPAAAVECDPAAGCTPRLMLLNRPTGADGVGIVGVFDLDTRAFIASATVAGSTRLLLSLGTQNDGFYGSTLQGLAASAASSGIDLARILQTEVKVASGGQQTSVSLLNGLQIDPTTKRDGVTIVSDATVQAGIVLNIYSSLRLTGGACVTNKADSSTAPRRYQRNAPDGYTVRRSDALPSVPSAGALGALVGGPVYNVQGAFRSDALVNTSSSVIGVDTAANEPNGYPVWVSPFVSPVSTVKPRTMDFVGTGTWSASESPVASGCLVVDFLLGTGVAVYNNPLPVSLSTILDPLVTPSPAAQQLTDVVDEAISTVVTRVTTEPAVADLLGSITAALPLADALP